MQAHGVPDQTGYVCRLMVFLIRLDLFAGSWCPTSARNVCMLTESLIALDMFAHSWYPQSDWICFWAHAVPDQTGYMCRLFYLLLFCDAFKAKGYAFRGGNCLFYFSILKRCLV